MSLDRLLRWPGFPRALQVPLLLGLAVVTYLAFRAPQHSEMNVGAAIVWQLWWTLLPFSVLLLSRLWCAICPFSLLVDIAERSSLARSSELSPRLRRLLPWLSAVGLLLLGFAFLVFSLESNGLLSAALLATFAAATVATGLAWRGRVWCQLLCPVGLMMGLYARMSWLRLVPASEESAPAAARAARRCPAHTSPVSSHRSERCLLCGACLQAPEGHAVTASFTAPVLPGPRLGAAQAASVSLLFGLLVVDVLRMTPLFLGYMSRAVPALKGNYELAMALGMAGILVLLFTLQCALSLATSAGGGFGRAFAAVSAALLPLAFAVQMGLSAQHLMITGEVLRNLGAELSLLAPGHIPPDGAYSWIWPLKLFQSILLLGGAYLALGPGNRRPKRVIAQTGGTTLVLLFLFAQPMSITC